MQVTNHTKFNELPQGEANYTQNTQTRGNESPSIIRKPITKRAKLNQKRETKKLVRLQM